MVFFFFFQEAIFMSGGIILFIIALNMIFFLSYLDYVERSRDEPFIVPLAVPLVAGPSALTIIILLPQEPFTIFAGNLLALFFAWLVSAVILVSSTKLYAILTIRGLKAMERLMGMLLILMAVQMFLRGIKMFASNT